MVVSPGSARSPSQGREKVERIGQRSSGRLRLEVVEDKDRLNMPDLEKATVDDIQALCDRFHEWVASVGEDPKAQPPATLGSAAFLSSTPRLSQPLLLCRRRFHRRGLQWI
jgi:hypothetical protein